MYKNKCTNEYTQTYTESIPNFDSKTAIMNCDKNM